mmetsp:Transcript_73978/g.154202  ORF Transcript_73978/g.154202 Transcript_73978/m.154202 type:complete len:385 (-) Transcript_73978:188-1342(-)|eukprot:CAMPEP_0206433202 /NCGR_PEP_ID=MMETSP0324_2-20121206/8394_1 /ASSEMBLY_ACC=CAM_ASM_000836 /TAXON_ID=2866 /ORGANISM="Crypthecodinium cohnii, Strain Seligo" /LENGTH=384 /DNA_ID=CAMNT_0053899425 /DNA_START=107 /DNA_END=1261 /DNA_ORIENTATION=+
MATTVHTISSQADLDALWSKHSGICAVLLWAQWHEPSKQLTKVIDVLAGQETAIKFGKVDADVCPDMASTFGADQVPFVAFFDSKGHKIDALAGADPPKLVEKVKQLASRSTSGGGGCGGSGKCSGGKPGCKKNGGPGCGGGGCGGGGCSNGGGCKSKAEAPEAGAGEEDLRSRLRKLIEFSPIMLFMKGNKSEPFCGFSRKAVELLERVGAEYSTFDILADPEVREGLKEFANWKTYPQLYIKGELVGGLDIMKEMEEDGSLQEAIKEAMGEPAGAEVPLKERLHQLINQAEVMLFMKGNKQQPYCGFSRQAVALLNEHGVQYETFDILGDEEVRQGLKEYSNWKTYPQLYVKGELAGGLDIMKEMVEDGSLMDMIPDSCKTK